MVDQEHSETDRLRQEVARLRTENEQLRARYRVAEPEQRDAPERQWPVRVLLLQPLPPRSRALQARVPEEARRIGLNRPAPRNAEGPR